MNAVKTKVAALLLSAALMISLGACQNREQSSADNPQANSEQSSQTDNEVVEEIQPDQEDTKQSDTASGSDGQTAGSSSDTTGETADNAADSTPSSEETSGSSPSSQTEQGTQIDPNGQTMQPAQGQTATLYIGRSDTGFTEYPVEYTGTLTPEWLIEQIASLTGWNLDLADSVSSGKGGMTVDFAATSSIVTGPPEPQKDDFFVYDSIELVQTILDSIQHTLQYNFVDPELGDPNNLDVYFCLEGGDITLADGPYVPHDLPYSGLKMQ